MFFLVPLSSCKMLQVRAREALFLAQGHVGISSARGLHRPTLAFWILLTPSFIRYGNDIEVGMYFLRPGVEPVPRLKLL